MTSQIPDSTDQTASNPPVVPPADSPEPSFGWTTYAEQLNGRFAMIGIMILLALELLSNQTFFEWIGWR